MSKENYKTRNLNTETLKIIQVVKGGERLPSQRWEMEAHEVQVSQQMVEIRSNPKTHIHSGALGHWDSLGP